MVDENRVMMMIRNTSLEALEEWCKSNLPLSEDERALLLGELDEVQNQEHCMHEVFYLWYYLLYHPGISNQ